MKGGDYMSDMENYENDAFLDEDEGIIELEDEDGNVSRFEFIDRAELDGTVYYALIPEVGDDNPEVSAEFVVLKEAEINGEAMLATVDDDDEYQRVGEMFLQRFAELPDLDISELEELDGADGE